MKGWTFESIRHALSAKGIKTGRKKKITFERGNIHRAERDVLARELEKHKDHISTPYALATYAIEHGAKVHGKKKEIAMEFKEQKAARRK